MSKIVLILGNFFLKIYLGFYTLIYLKGGNAIKRIVCVSSYEQMQKYVKKGYINVMLSGFLPELSNYTLEKGPYPRILRRWQRIQTKQ